MKFSAVLVGVALLFFQSECLEKTQEEAHKFLIDKGHVAADSTVQSFQIDREGNLRLQIDQAGKLFNYGLDASAEEYEINFMSKNKGQKKKKSEDELNVELGKLIGEKYAILKNGKLGAVTRSSTRNKQEFEAEYTVNSKTYKISGRYNVKRADLTINKIEQVIVTEL